MKGGFGCSPCCGPTCEECTRECQNPHTGDPFETKYTLYFEGVEIGNPGGVYLQASGDVDTSDPYDGMDGNGPWSQTVSSVFTLSPTSSRIPCVFRASFWRSNFVLGASTVPPPATTLITNEITITNEASSEGAILYGDLVLQPGESHTITGSIPVVSGAGDQSTNDPRSARGSVSIRAACANQAVSFIVSATISWNVKKRQHVLYGLVRECYEENGPSFCTAYCTAPAVPPDEVYLTLSNFSITGVDQHTSLSGSYYSPTDLQAILSEHLATTFVVPRIPGWCGGFELYGERGPCSAALNSLIVRVMTQGQSYAFMGGGAMIGVLLALPMIGTTGTGFCVNNGISLWVPDFDTAAICGGTYSKSGTATFSTTSKTIYGAAPGVLYVESSRFSSYAGSFDWLVES